MANARRTPNRATSRTDGHCLDILDQRGRISAEELARESGLATAWELFGPLAEQTAPLLDRYDDEQLRLLIDFNQLGRQAQEQHAQWLRDRLRSQGPIKRD